MDHTIFEELELLLKENRFNSLRSELIELNEVDIADFIAQLDKDQTLLVFRILPKTLAAEVFAYLDTDLQQHIVISITDRELTSLVDELYIDDTVDFLEEVPANIVRRVMAVTDRETRETINKFLKYEENSAGSIMTSEMVEIHSEYTVEQAITQIRKTGVDKETVYTCYCIDKQRHLVGTVGLRDIIFANPDMLIEEIMESEDAIVSVSTSDDQEYVAELARKYDLLSIPVVDSENRLVGIVTIDDIVDIIEEENTEDFEKMALLAPSEDTYLKTPVITLAKNRIVWLMILMISATFTGMIIEGFESKLALIAGLTASIPMLMDTGGNSGNQVSTLIIRGLALGEITLRDYFKVLWKELRVALICGVSLASVNFIRMYVIGLITGSHSEPQQYMIYLVVCLAMLAAVIVAKLIGCSLPMLAKRLKLDPALMAGPMITTIVDAMALLIYFGLATLLLTF